MITQETVYYIASLARLHLNEGEAIRFSKDLEGILQYVEKLNTVDVSLVRPTSHVLDVKNVFREDDIHSSLANPQAMDFAVEQHEGFFKVPKVIE